MVTVFSSSCEAGSWFKRWDGALSFIGRVISNAAPLNHRSINVAATGHPRRERITPGMSSSRNRRIFGGNFSSKCARRRSVSTRTMSFI